MPMLRAIRLRRTLVPTLILTAMIFTTFPVAQASASTNTSGTRYTYTSSKICPIKWRQSTWKLKRLLRCAARYYGVNVDKALEIAKRESRFVPTAYNATTCAKGIYQHLCKYWPTRAYDFGFRDWSAYNARANIIVTMKMVRRYGWGPWGG